MLGLVVVICLVVYRHSLMRSSLIQAENTPELQDVGLTHTACCCIPVLLKNEEPSASAVPVRLWGSSTQ